MRIEFYHSKPPVFIAKHLYSRLFVSRESRSIVCWERRLCALSASRWPEPCCRSYILLGPHRQPIVRRAANPGKCHIRFLRNGTSTTSTKIHRCVYLERVKTGCPPKKGTNSQCYTLTQALWALHLQENAPHRSPPASLLPGAAGA